MQIIKLWKYASFLLGLTIILFGCEGPIGARGPEPGDLFEPEVDLEFPLPSTTIFSDTFTIVADAYDKEPSEGIELVRFFIDDTDKQIIDIDGVSTTHMAVDSTAPYSFLWSMKAAGIGYGIHLIYAETKDKAGFTGRSVERVIYYVQPVGLDTIDHSYPGESLPLLFLPNTNGDRYFNVRFYPKAPCKLLEIHLELFDPVLSGLQELTDVGPFYLHVWNSDALAGFPVPGPSLDSLLIPENDVTTGGWISFDVRSMGQDGAGIFFEGNFHAGFSPPDDQYDEMLEAKKGIAIGTILHDPPIVELPENHRSMEYETTGESIGWGTIFEDWGAQLDLQIRVVVDYGDGQTSSLLPE